jgi:hypothetical protein
MARAWELSPTIVGFNFDKPEEVILIHHFELAISIVPSDVQLRNFAEKFFDKGMGVSEFDFRHIMESSVGKRQDHSGFAVKPSGRSTYIDTRDQGKAAMRQIIRDQLAGPNGRDVLAKAFADLERLEPMSDNDFEQQKYLFEKFEGRANVQLSSISDGAAPSNEAKPPLTEEEKARRRSVLNASQMPNTTSLQPIPASKQETAENELAPGMGDQPDMAGVDLLQFMHSDRIAAEGVPEPSPTPQHQSREKPSSSELLLDIRSELREMNSLLRQMIAATDK